MSTPNMYPHPGENPDNADAVLRELAELSASPNVLLEKLHAVFDTLYELHEMSQEMDDIHQELQETVRVADIPRYGVVNRDERIIQDTRFMEYKWVPKRDTPTSGQVKSVWVRHPILWGEPHFDHDDDRKIIPNDILIEVVPHAGEETHRYLLNSKGVQSYADGESIDYDDTELFLIDRSEDDLPNLFRVTMPHWYIPDLTAAELNRMLFEDSKITPYESDTAE